MDILRRVIHDEYFLLFHGEPLFLLDVTTAVLLTGRLTRRSEKSSAVPHQPTSSRAFRFSCGVTPSFQPPPRRPTAPPCVEGVSFAKDQSRGLSAQQQKDIFTPSQLMIGMLLLLIIAGSLLLSLPFCHVSDAGFPMVDAVFMATSALCVTGLSVLDPGTDLTVAGQVVIFCLFQLGALGMLLWSSTIIVLLGGQLGLRHRLLVTDQTPGMSLSNVGSLTRPILFFILTVELLGGLLLWLCWFRDLPGVQGLYYAIFHASSAFCNAGFSLWDDSLARYSEHIGVNVVMISLIFVGGLGFAVVRDLVTSFTGALPRLSVHTKIVLTTSIALLLGGAVIFYVFESQGGVLVGRDPLSSVLISMFQSTTRTAGLSTVPTGELLPETWQLLLLLMFIGGSPGSTAGGLKTTTFAVLVLAAWSQARGTEDVEAFGRRLPIRLVFQALAMTVIAFLTVMVLAMLLNYLEDFSFAELLFESVSALAIVGLSTGITPELSSASKLLLCFAMIVGRVGPLTLAVSVLHRRQKPHSRYPKEDILLG